MRTWTIAAVIGCILVGIGIGAVIGKRAPHAAAAGPAGAGGVPRTDAVVLHELVKRETVRVDLYVPKRSASPPFVAPFIVFAHERGWPAPDEKERVGAAFADAMQRRGIGVAVVSFDVTEAHPLARATEEVADVVRDLARRASEHGLATEPVLAGDEAGASLVVSLALDPRFGFEPAKLRGVIGLNGVYEVPEHPRADAPPFLVLSAHDDSPRSAQSSRALVRALERGGAKRARGYHTGIRDARSLTNVSGDQNEVGDVIAAFVRGEPTPGGPEGTWALSDVWGAKAPLSTEPFWTDERLVTRRPTDARFRAEVRNVFGEMIHDLEPWPALTYDALDLGEWLSAHPELGSGDFLEVTNSRGEKIVLSRSEIEKKKPVIVVGIDDERNLFRMFVTYNVHRTYSWKPETEPRPLLVRHIGAFLYLPTETEAHAPDGALHVVTLANFALTKESFHLTNEDPLAVARKVPKPLAATLTNEQGCLQCHALHGNGGRAHHVRASDGKLAEGFGLPLEEYPPGVLRKFLFEQEAVSKSFGVSPLNVDRAVANQLLAEVAH